MFLKCSKFLTLMKYLFFYYCKNRSFVSILGHFGQTQFVSMKKKMCIQFSYLAVEFLWREKRINV